MRKFEIGKVKTNYRGDRERRDATLSLKSGSTWTGQLWPKGSGVEGSPITVDMYGGGVKPANHGDGRVHDAVLLKKQEYWDQEPTRPGSDATN